MRILPNEPQNPVSRDSTWVIFSWAFSLQQLDILLLKPLQKISSCPIIIVEAVKVILSEKTSLSSRHDQSAILIVTFSATLLQYQKYQSVKRRREA